MRPAIHFLRKGPCFPIFFLPQNKAKDRRYLQQNLVTAAPSIDARVQKARSSKQKASSGRLHRNDAGDWVWSSDEEEDGFSYSSDSAASKSGAAAPAAAAVVPQQQPPQQQPQQVPVAAAAAGQVPASQSTINMVSRRCLSVRNRDRCSEEQPPLCLSKVRFPPGR